MRTARFSTAPPESWPAALALDDDGRLRLDGVGLAELARERRRPLADLGARDVLPDELRGSQTKEWRP